MLAICSADKPVVFKAPKLSSNAERVSQGTKPRAQPGHKKHSTSLKQPFVSNKEAIKVGSSKPPISSKTSHSKKRKEEDQQATGGPTSLGVTSEARANPQLTSGMSSFNLNKPIYLASFIIHSESASGNDASAISTAEVDLGKSAPSDFVPQQQGMNKGTKNTSYDHSFAGTDPHVLADQTKSVREGLETVLTQPRTGKGASSITRQVKEEEASSIIKLEDLAKLVSNVQPSFKYLDSPKDDPVIVVDDSDEDEEDELNELLVKSLQTEFSKILATHDFSSSLPTELKDLPSKFNELTEEVKGLKKQVASVQAKLKTLDALPCLLLNVTKALNKFAQVLDSASSKARDQSVPSAGQADTMSAEGEKNTNQATIS
ncbi:hypothetical protein Tco_0926495 [Tanacetum coccineum]|uniref:Uncharacterized protein n=1 Tax=Tanacetum coccineum TaxID=301880 RepID=A0ABQ5DCW6_9ASTR